MMPKILQFLKNHLGEILIVILTFFIVFVNYVPHTTLTGWDNLHPEYNLSLNIKRSLSSVWQEYQGVGLLGGMAHAADLPRQLMLIPFVLTLPANTIRYISTFSFLLMGPLGAYVLFQYLFKGRKLAPFVGALFYLLNLATIQTFYVPYESFVAFFGFLPWLLWASLSFLEFRRRKEWLILVLTFFVGATAFYVQTLLIVSMMVLSVFVLFYVKAHGLKRIKTVFTLFATIFVTSAFWLLPVLYFTLTNVHVVSENKINSISTIETEYMNQAFGSLDNIAKLKGFWTNYIDAQGTGYGYLMNNWQNHLNGLPLSIVSYLLFGVVLIGIFAAFRLRKTIHYSLVFPILLIAVVLMLSAGNGAFGVLFSAITNKIPLFGQIFRSSFTKWSTVAALTFGWGIALTVYYIEHLFQGKKRFFFGYLCPLFCVLAMSYSVYPVFQGKLISDNMRLAVPSEYNALFDFMKTQPREERIAFLPAQQIWGWNFYDWGYRGSGFLWYGIEQPIFDRAFDVWSHENESFYQEFEYAWYKAEPISISRVLKKYQVRVVLVDKSVVIPTAPNKDGLGLLDAQTLLNASGYKELWSQGNITLYQNSEIPPSFVGEVTSPAKVSSISSGKLDHSYMNYGNYILHSNGTLFPFLSVTAESLHPVFKTDFFNHDFMTLAATENTKSTKLAIPAVTNTITLSGFIEYTNKTITVRFLSPFTVYDNGQMVYAPSLEPLYIGTNKQFDEVALQIGNKVLYIPEGKTQPFEGVKIDTENPLTIEVFNASEKTKLSLKDAFLSAPLNTCWERNPGEGVLTQAKTDEILQVSTKNIVGCASYKIGSYPGNKHLLSVSVPFMSPDRARPDFCLVVEGSSDCLHDEVFYNSQTSSSWSTEKRDVLVEASKTYWLVLSARPSDTPNEVWHIEYKAPEVNIMSNVAEFEIKPSYWKIALADKNIDLNEGSHTLSVEFPISHTNFDPTFSGRGGSYNCDLFKRGEVNRVINGSSVTFEAKNNAIECDYRLLTAITQNEEYILRILGGTTDGRSPKIYVYNEATKKNDIEALLLGEHFDTSFALLSEAPHSLQNKAFTINYEARSFGPIEAVNTISEVKVYPFNLSWLANWHVSESENKTASPTKAINTASFGTFLYIVKPASIEKNAFLTLSQGYNAGWIAFSSHGILDHTRLNSWENAWSVTRDEGTIFILYLPQVLEYVGLIALIVGGTFAIIRHTNH